MAVTDADNLRADLDGGYAKVTNLLAEALCRAPLSGSELRVVWFIIRRTYGHNNVHNDRQFKGDLLPAVDVSSAIGMPQRTVESALSNLVKSNVIWKIRPANEVHCLYGLNPEVASWGDGSQAWRFFQPDLKDSRDAGRFKRNKCTQNYVHLYSDVLGFTDTMSLNPSTPCPQILVHPTPLSLTGTGAGDDSQILLSDSPCQNDSPLPLTGSAGADGPLGESGLDEPETANGAEPEPRPVPPKPDHAALIAAVEGAYTFTNQRQYQAATNAYLRLLQQPGCQITEAQLADCLNREKPMAGGTPDSYMVHAQGMVHGGKQTAATVPREVVPPGESLVRPPSVVDVLTAQAAAEGPPLVEMPEAIRQRLAGMGGGNVRAGPGG